MSEGRSSKMEYVNEYYYRNYAGGVVDMEVELVGNFLVDNAYGKVLDCGCGPVPQVWAMLMPSMTKLYAIDLPIESVLFARMKISEPLKWIKDFTPYLNIVKIKYPSVKGRYLLNQLKKITSVIQADMTKQLPFHDNFFDTIVSLYSLGCLKSINELQAAIQNIWEKLKPGGVFLHINTNGKNKNDKLPEYTWQGVSQSHKVLKYFLEKRGFVNIEITTCKCRNNSSETSMYNYDQVYMLKAMKKVR